MVEPLRIHLLDEDWCRLPKAFAPLDLLGYTEEVCRFGRLLILAVFLLPR